LDVHTGDGSIHLGRWKRRFAAADLCRKL